MAPLRLWPTLAGLVLAAAQCAAAGNIETEDAVTVSVSNVSTKVGSEAFIVARVAPRAGYRIAADYSNRVIKLSAEDNGVTFASKPVRGKLEDGVLVFKVPVSPSAPGAHVINGLLRFAFVSEDNGEQHLDIKSAPLIGTVTGTTTD